MNTALTIRSRTTRWVVVPILVACFLMTEMQVNPVSAQIPAGEGSIHLWGLAPFDRDHIWAWGMKSGQFVLIRTENGGSTWASCSLPSGLSEFVSNEGAEESEIADDLSVSFSDPNNLWVTWIHNANQGVLTSIVTAHSNRQCQTWNIASAAYPKQIEGGYKVYGPHLGTTFYGRVGWALVSDDPATAMCPQAFLKTTDGGKSWLSLPSFTERLDSLPESCPDASWGFYGLSEGWFTHTNPYDEDISRILWKTTDGGQTWKNMSAQIKLPPGIKDGNSVVQAISLPAFSSTNPSVGTLGVVYNQRSQEEVNNGTTHEELAIYRTNDAGASWQFYKVVENNLDREDNLTFQDNLHGFLYAIHVVDENTVDIYLSQTGDGGATWNRNKLPEGIRENVVIRQNRLWAIQNAGTHSQETSLLTSQDGGRTWQKRAIEFALAGAQ